MWYLRVSNPKTVGATNCFYYTDSQKYERCVLGNTLIFTDAPDSHYTIDQFIDFTVSDLTTQLNVATETIGTLETQIKKLRNPVHATAHPVNITIHRLKARTK